MKIWKSSCGYTMAEMLVALATAMLCSLLLTMLSRWMVHALGTQRYLVQDQMAVLQLRLYVAQCDTYALADETLNTLQDGETFTLHFHNGRLVKQPGYEIFLTDVDDAVFIREGDAYYLQWQREGRRWQAKISE